MSERPAINANLVRRLVAAQFPQWAQLPVTPVEPGGWDNRTFRLGEDLSVRLPSRGRYAAQVEKEQAWLPLLAAALPLPIPAPVAMGEPGEGYAFRWSVNRWLPGETLARGGGYLVGVAEDLARFLSALHAVDASAGPAAGAHNFHRGGDLAVYDGEVRATIATLGDRINGPLAMGAWERALTSRWKGAPVWVHGDVAPGNLLVRDGRLSAVIDFGSCGVGDPACDLAIAWTTFAGDSRKAFRAALPLDPETWARGRGWALWKGLIVAAAQEGVNPDGAAQAPSVIAAVLEEHRKCS